MGESERDQLNRVLHLGAEPCKSACTHVLVGRWTALGAANVLSRVDDSKPAASTPRTHGFTAAGSQELRDLQATEAALAESRAEVERLREFVKLADAFYVAADKQAQEASDKAYRDEFGPDHKGPSLAGFVTGGADREYHYARHMAGECPLPKHQRYMTEAPHEST